MPECYRPPGMSFPRMSALPPKAAATTIDRRVRFGPRGDSCTATITGAGALLYYESALFQDVAESSRPAQTLASWRYTRRLRAGRRNYRLSPPKCGESACRRAGTGPIISDSSGFVRRGQWRAYQKAALMISQKSRARDRGPAREGLPPGTVAIFCRWGKCL
jgi:hypothetical protein